MCAVPHRVLVERNPPRMNSAVRNVLAFIIGFVVGSLVNMGLVITGSHVFPPPPGVNVADAQSLAASVHLLEPKHFVFPFLAHALGTFAGSLVAYLMASSRAEWVAWIIGALTLVGGIAASFMIPAPKWFIALDLVVAYLPMAWLAIKVGGAMKNKSAAPAT